MYAPLEKDGGNAEAQQQGYYHGNEGVGEQPELWLQRKNGETHTHCYHGQRAQVDFFEAFVQAQPAIAEVGKGVYEKGRVENGQRFASVPVLPGFAVMFAEVLLRICAVSILQDAHQKPEKQGAGYPQQPAVVFFAQFSFDEKMDRRNHHDGDQGKNDEKELNLAIHETVATNAKGKRGV